MKISKLWESYKFPKCENCKKDCQGHLDYDNLCSNLNYLYEYGEKNYEKNKESLEEFQKYIKIKNPIIFSFGCGLGLDYIACTEIFNENVKYFGIDETDWAIKKTDNYTKFQPKLPKTMKYNAGIMSLNAFKENIVLCFFNSLFTISNNTNLFNDLFEAIQKMKNFYIICDFTINSNYHMPKEEQDFLDKLKNKLSGQFKIKEIDILDGRGIILAGVK